MQAACSIRCAQGIAEAKREKAAKQAVAQDKRETRAKLEKMKTAKDLKPAAKRIAQKYARYRDLSAGYGCISCGQEFRSVYGGAFDGGHLRSKGSAQHLALDLRNIYCQCVHCNRDLGGNVLEFRRGLIERRGAEFVEALEVDQRPRKHDVAYLRKYMRIIGKRANRFEKRFKSMI